MPEEKSSPIGIIVVVAVIAVVAAYFVGKSGGGKGDQTVGNQHQPTNGSNTNKTAPQPKLPKPEKPAEPKEPAFVKEGLVAYYPLNGNAKDESGNGHDGEVTGATLSADRHGKGDSTYIFDGEDELIEVNDRDALDLGEGPDKEWSISVWCKPIDATGAVPGSTLVAKAGYNGLGGSDYTDYRIMYENGKWIWGTGKLQRGLDGAWMMHEADLQKKWTQLTVTYDSTGKGSKSIYINGEKVSTGGIGRHKCAALKTPLRIGADINSEYRSFWDGEIDDVRIYNRALSAEEVKALYGLEKPKE